MNGRETIRKRKGELGQGIGHVGGEGAQERREGGRKNNICGKQREEKTIRQYYKDGTIAMGRSRLKSMMKNKGRREIW